MVAELCSDNFGNKIKFIQKLDDVSDAWIDDNIKQIIDILSLNKGLKWFIKDYLLKNKINSLQINILNKLIDGEYNDKNKHNFSNGIDLFTPQNIFDITDHVLIKILHYLDTHSVYNFEKTCRHGTYIARNPSSLYHLSIRSLRSGKGKIPTHKNDMIRFSKIKSLQILSTPHDWDDSRLTMQSRDQFCDFINHISTNIIQVRMDETLAGLGCIFNPFTFYNSKLTKIIMYKSWIYDDTKLLEKLNELKYLEISCVYDEHTMEEVDLLMDLWNPKSSLQYLKIGGHNFQNGHSSPNINFIYKLLCVHNKTLTCVSITHKELHDIVRLLTEEKMEFHMDNIIELSLTDEYRHYNNERKTAAHKLISKYFTCNSIERLYVCFDKTFMPFRPTWICNFISQCVSNKSFKLLVIDMWMLELYKIRMIRKLFKNLIKILIQNGHKISIKTRCWYPGYMDTNELGTEIKNIKKIIQKSGNLLNWIFNVEADVRDEVIFRKFIDFNMWNKYVYNEVTYEHTLMDIDINDEFYFQSTA